MTNKMNFKTADISDQISQDIQHLAPIFKSLGGKQKAYGQIVTIKCHEDNSLVRELVATDGKGKFMVVDGGGSTRCALLGDLLAEKACENNWSGILVYGLIRDSHEISQMPIGVWALGTLPLKSIKLGMGQTNIKLTFGGVDFKPGEYVYADHDGIVVIKEKLK